MGFRILLFSPVYINREIIQARVRLQEMEGADSLCPKAKLIHGLLENSIPRIFLMEVG